MLRLPWAGMDSGSATQKSRRGGLTMTLTEMFTICDSCAYSPCLCGNDPENCVAYVMRTSHTNTLIGKYTTVHDGRTDNG